jgi:hypothetical protein
MGGRELAGEVSTNSAVERTGAFLEMLTYVARPPVLWLGLQELQNEVLGIVADILPVPLVEHNLGAAALIDEVLEILGAEGRVATEQGVGNDTERPHIDGLAVALL